MNIENREIRLFGDTEAEVWVIQLTGEHENELIDTETAEIRRLSPDKQFCLVTVPVADWDNELSPWEAAAVLGSRGFGSGAADTLSFVTGPLLSALGSAYPSHGRKYLVAGYSLAGLFALWAVCNTDIFGGAAGVSPSVWFPGWDEYSASHPVRTPLVYLSLGDREEKARSPVLARVGDSIRRMHSLLDAGGIKNVLEWNKGNHFADADLRLARGISWLINK